MHTTLSTNETTTIRRAERALAIWRYGRWVQLIVGSVLLWYGFYLVEAEPNPALRKELVACARRCAFRRLTF